MFHCLELPAVDFFPSVKERSCEVSTVLYGLSVESWVFNIKLLIIVSSLFSLLCLDLDFEFIDIVPIGPFLVLGALIAALEEGIG